MRFDFYAILAELNYTFLNEKNCFNSSSDHAMTSLAGALHKQHRARSGVGGSADHAARTRVRHPTVGYCSQCY